MIRIFLAFAVLLPTVPAVAEVGSTPAVRVRPADPTQRPVKPAPPPGTLITKCNPGPGGKPTAKCGQIVKPLSQKEIFARMDADHSGQVSEAEFLAFHRLHAQGGPGRPGGRQD